MVHGLWEDQDGVENSIFSTVESWDSTWHRLRVVELAVSPTWKRFAAKDLEGRLALFWGNCVFEAWYAWEGPLCLQENQFARKRSPRLKPHSNQVLCFGPPVCPRDKLRLFLTVYNNEKPWVYPRNNWVCSWDKPKGLPKGNQTKKFMFMRLFLAWVQLLRGKEGTHIHTLKSGLAKGWNWPLKQTRGLIASSWVSFVNLSLVLKALLGRGVGCHLPQ